MIVGAHHHDIARAARVEDQGRGIEGLVDHRLGRDHRGEGREGLHVHVEIGAAVALQPAEVVADGRLEGRCGGRGPGLQLAGADGARRLVGGVFQRGRHQEDQRQLDDAEHQGEKGHGDQPHLHRRGAARGAREPQRQRPQARAPSAAETCPASHGRTLAAQG